MRNSDAGKLHPVQITWVQPNRSLEMFNSQVWFTGVEPEKSAPSPSVGRARIERERTVDYCNRGVDILIEIAEHMGNTSERQGVVCGCAERSVSEIDRGAPITLAIRDSPYRIKR